MRACVSMSWLSQFHSSRVGPDWMHVSGTHKKERRKARRERRGKDGLIGSGILLAQNVGLAKLIGMLEQTPSNIHKHPQKHRGCCGASA
eukprot:1159248-Pelagomonas_calceolata.AAC.5